MGVELIDPFAHMFLEGTVFGTSPPLALVTYTPHFETHHLPHTIHGTNGIFTYMFR